MFPVGVKYNHHLSDREMSQPVVLPMTVEGEGERIAEMAEDAELSNGAFNMQLVREFLERHFTIENEIKLLQQDKSELRTEFKERGLDMKTMTAAIAIAKKRQLVPVSKETLDELITEVENKLPAPED